MDATSNPIGMRSSDCRLATRAHGIHRSQPKPARYTLLRSEQGISIFVGPYSPYSSATRRSTKRLPTIAHKPVRLKISHQVAAKSRTILEHLAVESQTSRLQLACSASLPASPAKTMTRSLIPAPNWRKKTIMKRPVTQCQHEMFSTSTASQMLSAFRSPTGHQQLRLNGASGDCGYKFLGRSAVHTWDFFILLPTPRFHHTFAHSLTSPLSTKNMNMCHHNPGAV